MTNICKTCAGTGCLALPFAAKQGGLLLHVFGLIGIAVWNAVASQTLCDCLDILLTETEDHHRGNRCEKMVHKFCCRTRVKTNISPPPPPGSSKLSTVAFYAMGSKGLLILDIMTVVLLMGMWVALVFLCNRWLQQSFLRSGTARACRIVAYQDAIRSFLQGTPFRSGHDLVDAIAIAMLIAPLSIVPDMGYLNKTSAAGLSVLASTFLVIFIFGLLNYSGETSVPLPWFPSNGLEGASHWFGCTVFGFGIVPLTYNIKESMEEPNLLPWVTLLSLLLVAFSYIAIGIGLLILYPNVENDILSELPVNGFLPIITRLAMILVVMVRRLRIKSPLKLYASCWYIWFIFSLFVKASAPIIIVPCAELIEGKIAYGQADQRTKITVRFGICLVTVIISVGVPGFVNILTFVGCFSVAFVSFCVPPFLHLLLLSKGRGAPSTCVWVKDTVMLIWGLAATGISTTYTLKQLLQSWMRWFEHFWLEAMTDHYFGIVMMSVF